MGYFEESNNYRTRLYRNRKIENPGKKFYLELIENVVYDVNSRIVVGISLARRSLVMCGLILSDSGLSLYQITPEASRNCIQ